MPNAEPRTTSRAECVLHDIEERVARLRKSLVLLDQRIASDEAARRNEADHLRHHVDSVLAKVASLECQLMPPRRSRAGKGTIIMRAGQALAAATDSRLSAAR
jgi:hypothetical protein